MLEISGDVRGDLKRRLAERTAGNGNGDKKAVRLMLAEEQQPEPGLAAKLPWRRGSWQLGDLFSWW